MTQTQQKTRVSLRPLSDRILVRRLESETTIKGIILPDTAKKKQESAEVIAVGPGKKDKEGRLIPIPVKEGDVILMEKYSGQEVTLDGETYVIVRSDDLIALIK